MTYYRVAWIGEYLDRVNSPIADTDSSRGALASGKPLYFEGFELPQLLASVQVAKAAIHKGTWLISFVGYDNITRSKALKGCWLAIDESEQESQKRTTLPSSALGLEVVTLYKTLARLREIFQLGPNDVFKNVMFQGQRRL